MLRLLLVVYRDPLVTRSQPIALAVMMAETMIILQPVPQHQLRTLLTALPPWRHHTLRRLAALEVLDQMVALVHDGRLLLQRHCSRILV